MAWTGSCPGQWADETDAGAWFRQRTTAAPSLAAVDPEVLLRAKRRTGTRVSVGLRRATNRRRSAGWSVTSPPLGARRPAGRRATGRRLRLHRRHGRRRPRRGRRGGGRGRRAARSRHPPGQGRALWKSLAATTGDVVVFLDADLVGDVSHYVPGLLGPLLADPQTAYVKGCYTRPLELRGESSPTGGGRVTELTARPLLNALWPELAGVVLAGR